MSDPKKKPTRIIRIGDVSASIFEQATDNERKFCTVSLQKSYLDRENQRQYSGSLSLAELPAAIEVLRLAMDFIALGCNEAVVV